MKCPVWTIKNPHATMDMLGFIPSFLDIDDPRPAGEQFDERYKWKPFRGFKMQQNGNLVYPGYPDIRLLAETRLQAGPRYSLRSRHCSRCLVGYFTSPPRVLSGQVGRVQDRDQAAGRAEYLKLTADVALLVRSG